MEKSMNNKEYYILQSNSPEWKDEQLLTTELLDDVPWGFAAQLDLHCTPLDLSLLTFAIDKDASLPDLLDCSKGPLWLISEKFVSLLQQKGIDFITYPIRLVDTDTRQPLDVVYRLFHLLDCQAGIDKKKSVITENGQNIEKLVLSEEILQNRPLLFREVEYRFLLVHQNLLDEMEAAGLTGYRTVPVGAYRHIVHHKRRWRKLPLPS